MSELWLLSLGALRFPPIGVDQLADTGGLGNPSFQIALLGILSGIITLSLTFLFDTLKARREERRARRNPAPPDHQPGGGEQLIAELQARVKKAEDDADEADGRFDAQRRAMERAVDRARAREQEAAWRERVLREALIRTGHDPDALLRTAEENRS